MGHNRHWDNLLCFDLFMMTGFSHHLQVSQDDTSCKNFHPFTSSTIVSMVFWHDLCLFVQRLPCLTSTKPFFKYDSQCQTVLESADWCLWEVMLYVLANKELKIESNLQYCEREFLRRVLEKNKVLTLKENKFRSWFHYLFCPAKYPKTSQPIK